MVRLFAPRVRKPTERRGITIRYGRFIRQCVGLTQLSVVATTIILNCVTLTEPRLCNET